MQRRDVLGLGAASLAGVAAAAGGDARAAEGPPAPPPSQALIMIPMRDGVHVAASLWLPPGPGPFPVLIHRSLDRRSMADPRRASIWSDLIEAGYAFLGSDVRGRYESEGVFDPTYGPQEGLDGYDTVEWTAVQPWSNGRIGTVGLSHESGYQVRTALQHPPHLRAIATWTGGFAASQRVEGAAPPMSGGVTALIQTLIWLPNESEAVLDRLAAQGQDVTEARQVLRRMRTHPEETYNHLPFLEAPITRFPALKELLAVRMSRTNSPALPPPTPYAQLTTPNFQECGWYDPIAWSQFIAFSEMQRQGGTPLARDNQHLTAGPWPHSSNFEDRLGDWYFGAAAGNAGSGINANMIKFFDRHLRDRQVELPKVSYYVMGQNEWRTSDVWPPAGTRRVRYFLSSGGHANTAAGDGVLTPQAPTRGSRDTFIYDPENPVPTLGGAMIGALITPGMLAGPLEQSPIERRDDVLCYTSAPFGTDTEISGPVTLRLFASTSAVDTDFTAKLALVWPDGRSYNLCEAIQRFSGRDLTPEPEPAKPGETYELAIGIGQTSLMVMQGQRLRLQVSSSNFPMYDRNMNTGNPPGTDAHGIKATQTIFHEPEKASYLELPIAAGALPSAS
jgi:putative CocE/NonD family hydrolase